MGLFGLFKKSLAQAPAGHTADAPYRDASINLLYNLLFCDDLALLREHTGKPYTYPFNVLFSETSIAAEMQKVIDDPAADPRVKLFFYRKLLGSGKKPSHKELLAVIVEVGLDDGLDVLASFKNGTARYINQTGKILVWESTTDTKANQLKNDLFAKSELIVGKIGPWNKSRRPHPARGNTRITFLVSDGLYFGEAATSSLFNDQMAGPALASATQLMQYLTQQSQTKGAYH